LKKVLITQSNYIPWKGYFDAINQADLFVLYDDMQYTKRDWRNRNRIKTQHGLQWLTIPVEVKGKFFQKINETKVSDPQWSRDHWNAIKNSYSKAPYFKEYEGFFEELFVDCKEKYLSEINYRFLKNICSLLSIKTPFKWSSDFDLRGDKSEKLLNICLDCGASVYLSGPAAREYLDTELFSQQNIAVDWLDYSGYPEYKQLYDGFEHGVSIIDLIFNTGPQIKNHMKSFNTHVNKN
jgi:hypothetical protein